VSSQESLNLVFLSTYPRRLVPVNLNEMSGAIGEPNLRNALPLAPTTLAVELSKTREFSYPRPSGKRFNLSDRAKQREVHGAMVTKLRGAVNGKDRGQDKIRRSRQALSNRSWHLLFTRPRIQLSCIHHASNPAIMQNRNGVAEPFDPALPGTALSDCARRNPSEILSWPALFMSASAAIADPLLRRAFGRRARPSDPQRTARVRIGSSGLHAPVSRPPPSPSPIVWGRDGWGTTNRHE